MTTLLVIAHAWPQPRFLPGLLSFRLAHLACLWAFTRVARFASWLAPARGTPH